MRKITLTIEDSDENQKMSGTTTVDQINELYKRHGINGMTQLLIAINYEINKKTNRDVEILLPDEVYTLPKGKKW